MRRAAAGLLVAGALAALLLRTRPDHPVSESLTVMRLFWKADSRTRLYNSALFSGERQLGVLLLRTDQSIPLDADVRLCFVGANEERRRMAAFVLAPRRVFIHAGCGEPVVSAIR